MFRYSGVIYIALTCIALLLLTYNKGVAGGHSKSMLEFVTPSELMSGKSEDVSKQSHSHSHKKDCKHKKMKCVDPEQKPVDLLGDSQGVQVSPLGKKTITVAPAATPKHDMIASYKLGNGDKVKITVYGEKELSNTYLVNEEGFISMPLIGAIEVKGKTIQFVKDAVLTRLSDGYLVDPSVAIEVAEFRPIYVMGEVRTPGKYSFVTDMTVRNAVAIAGGFTYRANQKSVRILREVNKDLVHNIEGVETDAKIEPGDTILIKERFF